MALGGWQEDLWSLTVSLANWWALSSVRGLMSKKLGREQSIKTPGPITKSHKHIDNDTNNSLFIQTLNFCLTVFWGRRRKQIILGTRVIEALVQILSQGHHQPQTHGQVKLWLSRWTKGVQGRMGRFWGMPPLCQEITKWQQFHKCLIWIIFINPHTNTQTGNGLVSERISHKSHN